MKDKNEQGDEDEANHGIHISIFIKYTNTHSGRGCYPNQGMCVYFDYSLIIHVLIEKYIIRCPKDVIRLYIHSLRRCCL